MQKDELVQYLFDARPYSLADLFREWMESSPRVAGFVDTYRDKIRKKIRVNQTEDSIPNLQAELETAFLLLNEPRFALAYEPYAGSKTRGPDFTVTFRTRISFNLEVTRMQIANQGSSTPERPPVPSPAGPIERPEQDALASYRLMEIVCGKLGQFLPGMANVLVVAAEVIPVSDLELGKAMRQMKIMAERNHAQLLERNHFRSPADFFKKYLRMSALILRQTGRKSPGQTALLWKNPQARHPIPDKIWSILQRLL
jgi:hypothetical protein